MQEQETAKTNLRLCNLGLFIGLSVALCLLAAFLATSAEAQSASKPAQAAPVPTVLNLWPGVAPGSEQWKQPETALGADRIVNVTTPTLTAYLPDPSTATGARGGRSCGSPKISSAQVTCAHVALVLEGVLITMSPHQVTRATLPHLR